MLEAAASHPGAEALRGRGRVYVVPAPGGTGRWVVRHYHRGGAIARVLGDRYLRVGTPRPVLEFRVGRALEEAGIPTPAHVGAAVYPAGAWYRGDLVTELVPGSRDLAGVLFPEAHEEPGAGGLRGDGAVDPESAMRAAGSLVRLLHERGVVHRDLNLKNILIARSGEDAAPAHVVGNSDSVRALVLDLDRATVGERVSERARRRMLHRFWRSARKWEGRAGGALPAGLRRAFEAGYGG